MDFDAKEAKKHYDKYAARYTKEIRKSTHKKITTKIVFQLLGNVKGKRILDCGCGAGLESASLAKRGAKVFACDVSESMIELARKNDETGSVKFFQGDYEDLKFGKGFFDRILFFWTLHYKKDMARILKKLGKFLKQRGEIILVEPHPMREMMKHTKNYFTKATKFKTWNGIKVNYYFPKVSDYLNTSSKANLRVVEVVETRNESSRKKVRGLLDKNIPQDLVLRLVRK